MNETPFVGEDRSRLVDEIIAAIDSSTQQQQARWISLEGVMGVGKTRVIKEVYRRLSREQRSTYWPTQIETPRDLPTPAEHRKVLNPEFEYTPYTSPEFLWWGINCQRRYGRPIEALRTDLGALEKHAQHIDRAVATSRSTAWRIPAALGNLIGPPLVGAARAAFTDAGASMLGLPGPVMSLLEEAGRTTYGTVQKSLQRRAVFVGRTKPDNPGELFVESIVRSMKVVTPIVPLILVIEDIHFADELLLRLLAKLISFNSGVTILSTGLPGFFEQNLDLTTLFDAWDGERALRIRAESSTPTRVQRFSILANLGEEDSDTIVRSHLSVPASTRAQIVSRYGQPLAIELFCGLPRVQAIATQQGDVPTSEIERYPASLHDLYREYFEQLTPEQRLALALAARATPSLIAAWARRDTWHEHALSAAIGALSTEEQGQRWQGAVTWLESRADPFDWTRRVEADPVLGYFNEFDQGLVALNHTDDISAAQEACLSEALLARAEDELESGGSHAPHLARLALTLAIKHEAFSPNKLQYFAFASLALDDTGATGLAERILVAHSAAEALRQRDSTMSSHYWELKTVEGGALLDKGRAKDALILFEQARSWALVNDEDLALQQLIRTKFAEALVENGRVREGLDELHALSNSGKLFESNSSDDVLDQLAKAYRREGKLDKATELYERILRRDSSRLPENHRDLLITRGNIAGIALEQGLFERALEEFDSLLENAAHNKTPRENIFIFKLRRAEALLAASRMDDLQREFETLIETGTSFLGSDHPRVLEAEEGLAEVLQRLGEGALAIAKLQGLLNRGAGPTEVLEDGDRLRISISLANMLADSQRFDEADATYSEVSRDLATGVSTLSDKDVLTVRANVAAFRSELLVHDDVTKRSASAFWRGVRSHQGDLAGQALAVLKELKEILASQKALLGEAHPAVFSTRKSIASSYYSFQRFERALIASQTLLDDQLHLFGDSRHPKVLETRGQVLNAAAHVASMEEVVPRYEELLSEMRATLGVKSDLYLFSRLSFSELLWSIGSPHAESQAVEFVELCSQLLPSKRDFYERANDSLKSNRFLT